ncbi:MAG: hypothetical protein AAB966_03295 [Patescibacteria group bacterium]
MKIMVFLHGTTIMHKSGIGKTPNERVKQVEENEPSVHKYEEYVPVGKANEKVRKWQEQGAEIVYLSSHRDIASVKKDLRVLSKYNFPNGQVLYRHLFESYAKVAEKAMPTVLIEDDCESIGGEVQMTYPHIKPDKKRLIKSIVVKEFSGIDHLPSNLTDLLKVA